VQTIRLALPAWHAWGDDRDVYTIALYLDREASQMGFEYVSLGPVDTTHRAQRERLPLVSRIIEATQNVPPYSPFFPAAYAHASEPPAVALALECGDLVVDAYTNANSLSMARARLSATLEHYGRILTEHMDNLTQHHNLIFKGLDFSMAPFPTPEKSNHRCPAACPFSAHRLQRADAAGAGRCCIGSPRW